MTKPAQALGSAGELAAMAAAVGVAALAVVVVLGSTSPLLFVGATVGAIGLVYAARRPAVALVIMVTVETTNASGVLAEHTSLPVFVPSLVLGLLAIAIGLRDPQLRARLNVWTAVCTTLVFAFLATQVVAMIGSADPTASLSDLRRNGIDLIFTLIVLVLVQMTARPWTVAAVFVICLAALSVLTLVDNVVFDGAQTFWGFSTVTTAEGELITTPRYAGPLTDSNFWGRHLVMGLPLASALLTRALRAGRRPAAVWWCLTISALLAGVYLTQSRGTLLAAGVAIAVWFIACERSVRRWGLAAIPVALVSLAIPGVGNRLQLAIGQLVNGQSNGGHVDSSLIGRVAAQEQAAMMWDQRPYFGFGPGTFPGEVQNFADRVPTAVRTPPDGAHNIYLQLAGESGTLGLLGWTVMIGGFVAILLLRIVARPRSADRVLAAAACAAVVSWSVSSIALHLTYLRTLGVVLALVGALAPAWPVQREAVRALLRGVAAWVAAVLVGIGAFWAYFAANSSDAARATQQMTIIPPPPKDGWFAYALDIRSRAELLPTFAVLLGDQRTPVTIEADPVRGLLTFTVTAPTADEARDDVQLAASEASSILSESLGYDQFSLETVGSMQIEPAEQRSRLTPVVATGVGLAAALLTGTALSLVTRRRQREDGQVITARVPVGVG